MVRLKEIWYKCTESLIDFVESIEYLIDDYGHHIILVAYFYLLIVILRYWLSI